MTSVIPSSSTARRSKFYLWNISASTSGPRYRSTWPWVSQESLQKRQLRLSVLQIVMNFSGWGHFITPTSNMPVDRGTSCAQVADNPMARQPKPVSAINSTQRADMWESVTLYAIIHMEKIPPTVSSIYSHLILHCADTQCGFSWA